ncbi:threonine ammonia-lyase [Neotabrizicola shimadae]|uniref:Threonine/serine dehydratase n=1 Tax=Neotabrizicola shimadae TaxID=2807096 RepID=A0A8G0ZY18_9RHOB|nr:threonine/serine dehydratase [Neotabrizicola shimadae]QYZ71107.1 threonine/serine dehydratase [Neotabrizicola shimadae]
MTVLPTQARLAQAYAVTRGATRRTLLLDSEALALATGAARVFVKAENLQRAGSFKLRGAFWRLSVLDAEERARGVVAYSSGNFAQGLAAAGRDLGVPVTIVMPVDAPEVKRRATEAFGARVVLSHHGDRPREEVASDLAKRLAAEEGLALLHPFDDPEIVAGQAGAGLEALEQLAEAGALPDVVLCPAGGGGLMGGVALALRAAVPEVRLIAVEPAGYDGMGESLRRGERVRVAGGATICDALQATMPGEATLAACRAAGVEGVAVTDAEAAAGMRAGFEALKLVLEPSGAVAIGAALSGRVPLDGATVLIFATGGNIPFDRFAAQLLRET